MDTTKEPAPNMTNFPNEISAQPTEQQIQDLQNALVLVFDLDGLKELTRIHFDDYLEQIVPVHARNLTQIIYDLIREYAAKDGGLNQLLQAIEKSQPNNPHITEIVTKLSGIRFSMLPKSEHQVIDSGTVFYELILNEEARRKIRAKELNRIAENLLEKRVIILTEHQWIDVADVAILVALQLRRNYNVQSIFRWPQYEENFTIESILFKRTALKMIAPGIYLCFDIDEKIEYGSLVQVSRLLKQNNQYLILTTAFLSDVAEPALSNDQFWMNINDDIYEPSYLVDELHQVLTSVDISATELDKVLSSKEIARRLGSPLNGGYFTKALQEHHEQSWDRGLIEDLIASSKNKKIADKTHYLFSHLPDTQSQLFAVGLCLFGGLYEAQFFNAMKEVLDKHWTRWFQPLELFDYFHLQPLRSLCSIQNGYVNLQQSQQFRPLLNIAWQSYQYHIREALPVFAELIEGSVLRLEQPKSSDESARDQHLRSILTGVLGNIGCLSVIVVEPIILRLACHHNFGVQAAAARILAMLEPVRDVQSDLYALLGRWQKGEWKKPASLEINETHVQSTIERTLNYILANSSNTPLPTQLIEVAYVSITSQPNERISNIHRSTLRKLFDKHRAQVTSTWSRRLMAQKDVSSQWSREVVPVVYWWNQFAPLNLDISSWFISCFKQMARQQAELTISTLKPIYKGWLLHSFLPKYIAQMDESLLYIAQIEDCSLDLIVLFKNDNTIQQQATQQLLAQWQYQGRAALARANIEKRNFWWSALPTIGMISEEIDQREQFSEWIESWLQHSGGVYQVELVGALAELHRRQLKQAVIEPLQDGMIYTPIEEICFEWLRDRQAWIKLYRFAFLFWIETIENSLAQQCISRLSFWNCSLWPLLSVPFSSSRRRVVQALFPVVRAIYLIDPVVMESVFVKWQGTHHSEVRQTAKDLMWALRWYKWFNPLPKILR